jgi:hypothetical protein
MKKRMKNSIQFSEHRKRSIPDTWPSGNGKEINSLRSLKEETPKNKGTMKGK